MNRIQRALELAQGVAHREVVIEPVLKRADAVEYPAPPPEPAPRKSTGILRRRPLHTLSSDVCDRNRLKLGTDNDPVAEAYRIVRGRVLRWLDTEQRNTVAVVSAAPDEGKTLSAVNLALSIAQDSNHTVLLVDLDLRSPSVHSILELDVDRGIESFLANEARIEDLIVPVAFQRMAVLPCVRPVASSSEVLAGNVVRSLIAELRLRYRDRVILFDLPPALLGDDVRTFLPLVDAALLVVCDGTTRKDHLSQMSELLADVPVIGSVLNRMKHHPMRQYYR